MFRSYHWTSEHIKCWDIWELLKGHVFSFEDHSGRGSQSNGKVLKRILTCETLSNAVCIFIQRMWNGYVVVYFIEDEYISSSLSAVFSKKVCCYHGNFWSLFSWSEKLWWWTIVTILQIVNSIPLPPCSLLPKNFASRIIWKIL